MFKISKEERKIQFIYLLVLWIAFSLVFSYVCFFRYPKTEIRSQELVIEKINDENKILKSQLENAIHIDSLTRMLSSYDPSTSQVSLENNIEFELGELKTIIEARKTDPRYTIFRQLHEINSMQYYDKKEIWNSKNRFNSLEKNLEDCNVGVLRKGEQLNAKAISQANK